MTRRPPKDHEDDREKSPRFEHLVERLEEIVQALEAGSLPLEESLRLFEEGMNLVRQAEGLLRKAEARVEVLLQRDGESLVESFDVSEEG